MVWKTSDQEIYDKSLERLCDLVAPLDLNLRLSMKKVNLISFNLLFTLV